MTVTADPMQLDILRDAKGLRSRLRTFLKRYEACVKTAPSRAHLLTYVAGLVGALERKNVENIALDAEMRPRTLQAFLEALVWNEDAVARKNREIIRKDYPDPKAIGIIDETSFAKKGRDTVAVKRQHCGATGKTDNCVVSVHLAYATEKFAALADSDLFIPEDWCQDQERRRKAGIPEELKFRTKIEIALDLLERTLGEGMPMSYLTADEGYGRAKEFRDGVALMGLTYVVEVPCNLHGWTPSRLANNREAARVDELWQRGGPSWQIYHVKNTEKGPLVWQARAARFHAQNEGGASREEWLVVAQNVQTGEVKYFLSNASRETPIETILHVGFRRWQVERLFEDAKGETGMDHFELRRYKAVMRHLILTMTSILFLMRESARLEKKRQLESVTGAGDAGTAA